MNRELNAAQKARLALEPVEALILEGHYIEALEQLLAAERQLLRATAEVLRKEK